MSLGCKVVVVGAGPAGMAAATVAAESGCRVCLLDDNPAEGGQIWRAINLEEASSGPHGKTFAQWDRRMHATNLELCFGARVIAWPATNVLRIEREGQWEDMPFDRLIVATGARERFLPFPGWTLPGVMGLGGLQAMAKAGLPIKNKKIVLAGSGPLLLAVAAGLAKRGAHIAGVFEQAAMKRLAWFGVTLLTQPRKLVEGIGYGNSLLGNYRTGSWVTHAHGSGHLKSVSISVGGVRHEIESDYLGCAFHLVPNLELAQLLGCEIDSGYVKVDDSLQTSIADVYCAGEIAGIGGLEKALLEGEIAGLAVAGRPLARLMARRERFVRFAQRLDATFFPRSEIRDLADKDTLVCRCEDVARRALMHCRNWREAKLHTRCGMGSCQGRICGPATSFLFGWTHESVRSPLLPTSISGLTAKCEDTAKSSL
jgi:NADPH-dependent 2,4-dienoyl-CoA reductase/sulfur reductase-like enzyme